MILLRAIPVFPALEDRALRRTAAGSATTKGIQMMFAQRGGTTLALACSTPFIVVSCGYVGIGDDGRIFGYG